MADETKITEEDVNLAADYNTQAEKYSNFLSKSLEKSREITKEQIKLKEIEEGRLSLAQKQQTIRDSALNEYSRQAELLEMTEQDRLQRFEDLNAIGGELTEDQQKQFDILESIVGLNDQQIKQLRQEIALRQQRLNIDEKALGIGRSATQSMAGLLGVTTNFNKTAIGGFMELADHSGNALTAISAMSKGMAVAAMETFSATNMVGTFIDATIQQSLNLHNLEKQFQAATGAGSEYGDVLFDSMKSTVGLGISNEALAGTMTTLYNDFTQFSRLQPSVQKNLVSTGAQLEKMGVDAGLQAELYESYTRVLGFSAEESAEKMKGMVERARQLGMTPKEYTSNLGRMLPKLAMFGRKGPKIFDELQKKARLAGVSVDSLVSVTEQFDTFEKAAENTSKLNMQIAKYGGEYMDSMTMMLMQYKGPAAQLAYLEKTAGPAIEKMVKQIKKDGPGAAKAMADLQHISATTGMSVDELMKTYGKSAKEREAHAKKLEEEAKQQKSFNEMVTSATTVMDKLGDIGKVLAENLKPAFDMLGGMLDTVFNFVKANQDLIKTLVRVGSIMAAAFAMKGAFRMIGKFKGAIMGLIGKGGAGGSGLKGLFGALTGKGGKGGVKGAVSGACESMAGCAGASGGVGKINKGVKDMSKSTISATKGLGKMGAAGAGAAGGLSSAAQAGGNLNPKGGFTKGGATPGVTTLDSKPPPATGGGGGFFSGLMGKAKDLGKSALGSIKGAAAGAMAKGGALLAKLPDPVKIAGKALKGLGGGIFKALKAIGPINALISGFMLRNDIQNAIASGASRKDIENMAGQQTVGTIWGMAGGALGAVGGPIGSIAGYMGGEYVANLISENFDMGWLGKGVISIFGLGDDLEEAMKAKSPTENVPAYATGTKSAAPGLALVGEEGPELVKFKGGEEVVPSSVMPNIADMIGMSVNKVSEFFGELSLPSFSDPAPADNKTNQEMVAILRKAFGPRSDFAIAAAKLAKTADQANKGNGAKGGNGGNPLQQMFSGLGLGGEEQSGEATSLGESAQNQVKKIINSHLEERLRL